MLRCCSDGTPLDIFLEPDSPALSSLQSLAVIESELQTFPLSLAAKLTRLEKLDLSHNSFDHLPPCIAQLAAIQKLDFSYNEQLQLRKGDAAMLAALSQMRLLVLKKKTGTWSCQSMQTIILVT